MNKVFSSILLSIGFVLCVVSFNVFAEDVAMSSKNIDVIVNDNRVSLGNDAIIQNNRIFVRLREVYKSEKYEIFQSEDNVTVKIKEGFRSVQFTVGLNKVVVNNKEKRIDVSPIVVGNGIYIPLREFEEALGNEVFWDSDKNAVIVKEGKKESGFNFAQEISAKMIAMKYYGEDVVFIERVALGEDECYVFAKTKTGIPSIAVEKNGSKVYLIKEDYNVYKILKTIVYDN